MTEERVAAFCGGSPVAARFDPPVTRHRWSLEGRVAANDFASEVHRRCGLEAAALERALWHGGVYLDGVRLEALPTGAIDAGSQVTVYVFDAEPQVVRLGPEAILFDAQGIVAVVKPPWLPMQGTRASARISLETQVRALTDCPDATPIHRLDRQTSGIVLFARTVSAASWVSYQFRQRRVDKTYLAWTHPVPERRQWTVRGAMVQVPHAHHACFALGEPGEDGRDSETDFEILATDGQRAMVRARPKTGRTHQIRVHLAAGGTPIAGDTLYGPHYDDGHPASAPRVLLHAESLTVRLAAGAPPTTITVPPPADFPRSDCDTPMEPPRVAPP